MQVQSINTNSTSFQSLEITPLARKLLQKEKGAVQKIAQYTKELANSKYPVKVDRGVHKYDNSEYLKFDLGNSRGSSLLTPSHLNGRYLMVSTAEIGGDVEDDVVETLRFQSAERAKEVYGKLHDFIRGDYHYSKITPLGELDRAAYSAKVLTEAEIIPNKQGPWEWLKPKETIKKATEPKLNSVVEPKPNTTNIDNNKLTLSERLKRAWNVFRNKGGYIEHN